MLRCVEDLGGFALLDDLAIVHDVYTACHFAHDAKIMSNEQDCHVELFLQFLQQFEDLRLNGHVERGGWFVRDQQVRLVGKRHGDHHALALAAGELVRIGPKAFLRFLDPHLVQ